MNSTKGGFRNTVYQNDTVGGLTTFFTMSYIVAVNPSILATAGTGMPFNGVLTATVTLCFLMTLLMGLYAKLPFGVAPGMGLNAFFAYSIVLGQQVPWPTALGMVFWSGILFLLISITPLRESLALAIPRSVRVGAAAGIGLFLCFIGLKGMGLIQSDPVTFVKAGTLGAPSLLGLVGLFLGAALTLYRNPFAYLATIGGLTFLGFIFGMVKAPDTLLALPDFTSLTLKMDPIAALDPKYLGVIVAIAFTDLFDSVSTFVGVSDSTQLLTEAERPKKFRRGLIVDAFATFSAALLGTSPGTAYIESAAGIQAGARTGKAAVVTAFCFLPCLFLAPIVGIIPSYATAPILVLVGMTMFRTLKDADLSKVEDALPSFLTMALIPLSFSITRGILWGFISHVVLYVVAGRRREISLLVYVAAVVCVGLLWLENK